MGRLGQLFMYSVAPYLSIFKMAWIAIVSTLVFVVSFVWMPETPYFLVGQHIMTEARKVLIKLRGHDEVNEEL